MIYGLLVPVSPDPIVIRRGYLTFPESRNLNG